MVRHIHGVMNSECCVLCALCCFFEVVENNFCSLMLIGGSSYACMCRIPVKLDRNAFRSATEVGFRPVEKAEHQGCCGRVPPESGGNRNPALDSGTPENGTKAGMCILGPTKPCHWRNKRLHHGGGVYELCVSGVSLAKSLPSGSFLFPPERT